jgi:hypothetical protein
MASGKTGRTNVAWRVKTLKGFPFFGVRIVNSQHNIAIQKIHHNIESLEERMQAVILKRTD